MAFLGIDARTEVCSYPVHPLTRTILTGWKRTRHQINYPESYKLIFEKLEAELTAAREGGQPIAHLMILLGVPIAYPVRRLIACTKIRTGKNANSS